ncbi:MAG: P-loop NTPase [Planctomycetes bacterium]|nr:P-loop NTPase [Planctomycetota bacterium]
MSQIDQAFIQAYADEDYPSPTETPSLPIAAPHIQLYPATQDVPPPQVADVSGGGYATANRESWPSQENENPKPHTNIASMQRAMFEPTTAQPAAAPVGNRRPLSDFAAPTPARSNVFEPAFEVDAFRWPVVTDELLSTHGELFTPVVEQLLAASEAGQSMVGIAGATPGVGCSTVHMCLARLLAVSGKSVALVDSNFAAANLAITLGLEFDSGWEDVLTGKIPLAECVVRSVEDRMALLPLSRRSELPASLLSSIQTSVIAGVLRYHYDVVLFDLGAAGRDSQLAVAQQIVEQCRLDASIIVANTASESTESDYEINALMTVLGTSCLGVIGNFAQV